MTALDTPPTDAPASPAQVLRPEKRAVGPVVGKAVGYVVMSERVQMSR